MDIGEHVVLICFGLKSRRGGGARTGGEKCRHALRDYRCTTKVLSDEESEV
jgi:hypothetical protein